MSNRRDGESYLSNDGDMLVEERSKKSWGPAMPTAAYEVAGWQHFHTGDNTWFHWNPTIGVWDADGYIPFHFVSRVSVAADAYFGTGLVPAGMNGTVYRTPAVPSRLAFANGHSDSTGGYLARLYIGGITNAAANIVFLAASEDMAVSTLVALTPGRTVQARVGPDAAFPGGFVCWYAQRYRTTTP